MESLNSGGLVAVSERLPILVAIRFSSTSTTIRAAIRATVDGRPELLPRRAVVALLADFLPHLETEHGMRPSVLAELMPVHRPVPGGDYDGEWVRTLEPAVYVRDDNTGARVSQIDYRLDAPRVEMWVHFQRQPGWYARADVETEAAGAIVGGLPYADGGLWNAFVAREQARRAGAS
jgi:hypothetical protein